MAEEENRQQAQTAEQPEVEDKVSQGEEAQPSNMPTLEEYQELNNRYLRLAADFENFRRRQAQEREALLKYGAQSTLESLLPVLDNLARGSQSLNEQSDPKLLYKSFLMLSEQLIEALKFVGLEKMMPQGDAFNPEWHEAVSQVENGDVPDHSILDVYRDGYMYKDRVLRPAQVVVAVHPEAAQTANPAADKEFQSVSTSETRGKNPFQH